MKWARYFVGLLSPLSAHSILDLPLRLSSSGVASIVLQRLQRSQAPGRRRAIETTCASAYDASMQEVNIARDRRLRRVGAAILGIALLNGCENTFQQVGPSMEPSFPDGTVVNVETVEPASLWRG